MEDLSADLVESNSQIVCVLRMRQAPHTFLNRLHRHLSSSQSASLVLLDAIGALLPGWFMRHAVHLPIKHFRLIHAQLNLANREGWRLVREKTEAAKQGLETDGDLYSVLCAPLPCLRITPLIQ